jgi:hypothetical protein
MTGNIEANRIFESLLSLIEKLGLPLSVLAWLSVFFVAIFMVFVLKKYPLHSVWLPSLVVALICLIAHMLDYHVTLKVSPNLSDEANPIWRIVIDNLGLKLAKAYGFTGKLLLSIISFELFSYYLIQRQRLFPKQAQDFFTFWKEFGLESQKNRAINWANLASFFSFTFALIGVFSFYIALLNSNINSALYNRLPPMLAVLLLYIVVLVAAYLVVTYRAGARTLRKGGLYE